MVNIGIIGSGEVLRWHAIGLKSNANVCVKAIAARNPETGIAAANEFGARYYETYHEMFEKEKLDGIINLMPNFLHTESCSDAIDAGIRYIFCEKPLGIDIEKTKKLVKKAQATDTRLQVGYMRRFHPGFLKVKEALDVMGSIQFVTYTTIESGATGLVSYRDQASAWKTDPRFSGGGNLTHVGSHNIDFIRYLFGDITAVSCKCGRDSADAPEHYVNGRLYMGNGIEVNLRIGRIDIPDLGPCWDVFKGGWNETLEIIGDSGYISIANPSWEGFAPAKVTSWFNGQPGPSVTYYDGAWQWINEIEAFTRGIENGKLASEATTAQDAYDVDYVVHMMRRSEEKNGACVSIERKEC